MARWQPIYPMSFFLPVVACGSLEGAKTGREEWRATLGDGIFILLLRKVFIPTADSGIWPHIMLIGLVLSVTLAYSRSSKDHDN